jgi:hypothetical protein
MPGGKGLLMKVDSLIPASWFYMDEREKVKINWLLYEFACKFYEYIEESRNKAVTRWKARHSDEQVAEFCAYYSKRMRQSVLNLLDGTTGMTEVYEDYISDYCHVNTHRDNAAIQEVGRIAWDDLMGVCAACPCKCLHNIYERCEFFDRMEHGGYLS